MIESRCFFIVNSFIPVKIILFYPKSIVFVYFFQTTILIYHDAQKNLSLDVIIASGAVAIVTGATAPVTEVIAPVTGVNAPVIEVIAPVTGVNAQVIEDNATVTGIIALVIEDNATVIEVIAPVTGVDALVTGVNVLVIGVIASENVSMFTFIDKK